MSHILLGSIVNVHRKLKGDQSIQYYYSTLGQYKFVVASPCIL